MLSSVFAIFAPLQPSKIMFAAVFYNVACARTLYIRDTPKTVLFDVCSRFYLTRYKVSVLPFECLCSRLLVWYYMLVLSFDLGTLASVFFRFRLHSLFVPRNLCVKHYASFCIFMQSKNVYLYNIMINRKLCGIFVVSLAPLRKRPIFLLFVFSLFVMYWYFRFKQKQKRKSSIFAVFA